MLSTSDKAQSLEKEYHFQLYKRHPLTLVEGQGVFVKDSNGNTYIDALAGIAVNNLGHCHPNVVQAIQRQAAKLIHISNLYYNEPQSQLVKLLSEVSGMDRVFFCNSGSEAIEGAVKLARKYAQAKGKTGKIVSLENCFHGRTLAAITMGKAKYQQGFAPLPEGFVSIPWNDFESLQKAMTDAIAIVIEPVQGEGGVRPVDANYFREMKKLCQAHRALLIADEIQCGLGRTGKMFAVEHYDVRPDIITCAKALGGGAPIGAVLATEEVAAAFSFGDHGTTYGGNPLACAAAHASIQTIVEDDLVEAAHQKGDHAFARLQKFAQDCTAIREIRGKGLMIGIELNFAGSEVIEIMMHKGVLANCTDGNVIRLLPPLIIEEKELDRVIDVLVDSIKEVIHE